MARNGYERSFRNDDLGTVHLMRPQHHQAPTSQPSDQAEHPKCWEDGQVLHLERRIRNNALHAYSHGCSITRQAQEFIAVLNSLQLQSSWSDFVPCCFGQSKNIDLAGQAVIAAYRYKRQTGSSPVQLPYRRYGDALANLRNSIDTSEESLITVNLLSLFEVIMGMHTNAEFSHRYGVEKILLSHKDPDGPSEIVRSVLYTYWDRRFRAPVAMGTVSPFEDPYWLDADPVSHITMSPEMFRLTKLTNKLLIRLPRLILLVRQLSSDLIDDTKNLQSHIEDVRCLVEDLHR